MHFGHLRIKTWTNKVGPTKVMFTLYMHILRLFVHRAIKCLSGQRKLQVHFQLLGGKIFSIKVHVNFMSNQTPKNHSKCSVRGKQFPLTLFKPFFFFF